MNPLRGAGLPSPHDLVAGETADDASFASWLLARCPAHYETPLARSGEIERAIGIGEAWIKDERGRMGLGSFKALGASFAVARRAYEKLGERLFQSGMERSALEGETVITASAGNHGLSLAAGARVFGANAVVYLPETAPMSFANRLRDRGADVVIRGADYEASMAAAGEAASANRWTLISDSTWEGYDGGVEVMEGYLAMSAEIVEEMSQPPSHIFLQAGVGGLAAAVAAHARRAWGDTPTIAVVEPDRAPCIRDSCLAGAMVTVEGDVSVMGRLDCKEASHVALKSLARDADAFIAISDGMGEAASAWLTENRLATSASGGAAFAGLLAAREQNALELSPSSSVLMIISECPPDD
ncbi:MAG: pyridoxal-phosphate dependent enzyme [Pseudomonadota bacterium]